ncbi:hypothetical protein CDCA_CDCA18G4597 [Cyanidium caldarium]|uniref:Ribosome maturation protein SBDS n=1 Tax=Cyanidium caldarium TaxID=2771 RepID=A0AAV9J1V9_CYACA|nr:hypothetical protein CDCA_CDCA18G4597 [Cyanidium caldarium]
MFQPTGQKRLTNVSVIRYKRGRKRFEIACYPSTVLSYRAGHLKDLSEVLQVDEVFENVSKGKVAASGDLRECFGTTDRAKIIRQILERGELQVSERERQYGLRNSLQEIANIIAAKTVSRATQRPIPVGLVYKALQEAHFSVQPTRSVKAQALEAIRLLQQHSELDLERARMRLRVHVPAQHDAKRLQERLVQIETDAAKKAKRGEVGSAAQVAAGASVRGGSDTSASLQMVQVESEEWLTGGALLWTLQIDPGWFRTLEQIVAEETHGSGTVEVISLRVLHEGDHLNDVL